MLTPPHPRPRTQQPNPSDPVSTPSDGRPRLRALTARGRFGDPRQLVSELEAFPSLPSGANERFAGYGVMGSPFRSGHLLALRRFPASSVGPGYRSVWHRDPSGRWTFFQDVAADVACTCYFGAAVDEVVNATIDIDWIAPRELTVAVRGGGHRLVWRITLSSSGATRLMNSLGSVLPDSWWRSQSFLALIARLIPPLLQTGEIRLGGVAPNGQQFTVNPTLTWLVAASTATLDGSDLGELGPAPAQGGLGDFRIPQRGMFAIGRAFFDPVLTADEPVDVAWPVRQRVRLARAISSWWERASPRRSV
jgi:hypothetical protein